MLWTLEMGSSTQKAENCLKRNILKPKFMTLQTSLTVQSSISLCVLKIIILVIHSVCFVLFPYLVIRPWNCLYDSPIFFSAIHHSGVIIAPGDLYRPPPRWPYLYLCFPPSNSSPSRARMCFKWKTINCFSIRRRCGCRRGLTEKVLAKEKWEKGIQGDTGIEGWK